MASVPQYKQALAGLGFPSDFNLRSEENFNSVMAVWKEKTIEARKTNDDSTAATLSLYKALIQKRHQLYQNKKCPKCGSPKSATAEHCKMCNLIGRNSNKLEEGVNMLHRLESTLIPVPKIGRPFGELDLAFNRLGKGHIGDSFVTNRTIVTCMHGVKRHGGKIICRVINPSEKDPKKRQVRVWRTDGLPLDEVNAIVEKRLSGQEVQKPDPWSPPPPEVLEKLKRNSKKKNPSAADAI